MAAEKFSALVSEIGEEAMLILCKEFIKNANKNTYIELNADIALDPMNCPYHLELITGKISSPLENYTYSYSTCQGCSVVITESAKNSGDNSF
jgi:hypothetical protein